MFISKTLNVLSSIVVIAVMSSCGSKGGSEDAVTSTPPTVTAYSGNVDENSSTGTQVGVLTIDNGGSSITSISLNGVNSADFNVAIDGSITVANVLDYETVPFYQLSIIATNNIGSSTAVDLNISVNDIFEPTIPLLSPFSGNVDSNSSIGTQVGVLTINNGGSSLTSIVLEGINSGDFNVAIDGTITVAGVLDYATTPFYQLTVIASNNVGSSTPVDVNISVNDIIQATLPLLTPFSGNIDENSIPGTVVGQIGVDDGGSVVTFITLSGSAEGNFTVETNGTITIADGAILDYETKILYTLQAVATNSIGSSTPVDVNISINNLYDQVLKTAQTDSYDTAGYIVGDGSVKDDGFYQRGVNRNSTRNINETVTDNVTGLMWQDNTDASTVLKPWLSIDNYATCEGNAASPACFDTSGDTAETYCTNLTLGGYVDWRLPTRKELQSLSDYDGKDPAIDPVFLNTDILSFSWSSTSYVAISKNAWMVAFDGIRGKGGQYDDNKSVEGHVRCVRTGP